MNLSKEIEEEWQKFCDLHLQVKDIKNLSKLYGKENTANHIKITIGYPGLNINLYENLYIQLVKFHIQNSTTLSVHYRSLVIIYDETNKFTTEFKYFLSKIYYRLYNISVDSIGFYPNKKEFFYYFLNCLFLDLMHSHINLSEYIDQFF